MTLRDVLVERIRARGPLTIAEYMELALYHPELGYYARADRRSGRAGDFFTSVDVGPLFGELLAVQIAEMWEVLAGLKACTTGDQGATGGQAVTREAVARVTQEAVAHVTQEAVAQGFSPASTRFDLVEAGAGTGRLARDVLDAIEAGAPECYRAVRLHLVERSARARATHATTLGPHASRLAGSSGELPDRIEGIIYANELLDALPVHGVEMTASGLREIYADWQNGRFVERLDEPSTPALAGYFERLGLRLSPGARAEVGLAAAAWVQSAAQRLARGFLVLIDYGHEAHELFSDSHAAGTLRTYRQHRVSDPSAWLADPGEQDITADVDLTTIQLVAQSEGLEGLCALDQTYFLLGLGATDAVGAAEDTVEAVKRRLALKTLLVPGGLGSTHKVLILGKHMGRPALRGCSYRQRLT